MIAAKQFDPVVGIDIHIIQPPGPVPPVPVPHPFVGILLDPFDFAPIIGGTVMVNGIPRATAGTGGKCIPPHIPIGGVFVKPPGNECEVFMGSSTVLADGEPLSFLGMPALSCHDIGMPPPPRLKKKKVPKSLFLPTSVVLSVPGGAPVLVGGPPTVSMMALGMKAAMAGLGKAFKKLRKLQKASRRMKALSDRVHKAAKKAMDKLGVPPSVQNKVHRAVCTVTGHPVDVATGKVFTEWIDLELPGRLPFTFERVWYSCSTYRGPLGHGWHHNHDLALAVDSNAAVLRWEDGRPIVFARPAGGDRSTSPDGQLFLARRADGYELKTLNEDLTWLFNVVTDRAEPVVYRASAVVDRNGNGIRYRWDDHRLTGITDSGGRQLVLEYESTLLRRIHEPHPHQATGTIAAITYEYDERGHLTGVLDAIGQPHRYAYAGHLLAAETDRFGSTFRFRYDGSEPGARCVETWGDWMTFHRVLEYDDELSRTVATDGLGRRTVYWWNDLGLVERAENPLGHTHVQTWTESGQLSTKRDPLGRETSYEYDALGRLVASINAEGGGREMRFDKRGRNTAVVDELGEAWMCEYDNRGNLVAILDPEGGSRRFELDDTGRPVRSEDEEGRVTQMAWDPAGNLVWSRDIDGAERRYEYDRLGRLVGLVDPLGRVVRYERDLLGRLAASVDQEGWRTEYEYDGGDNLVCVRKPDGRERRFAFTRVGPRGSLWAVQEDGVVVRRLIYDKEGQLVAVANARDALWTFVRNAAGDVVAECSWFGVTRRFERDPSGRIVTVSSGGETILLTLDPMGRCVKREAPDGSSETFVYDLAGQLLEAANGDASVTFRFDRCGRVIEETRNGRKAHVRYDRSGAVLGRHLEGAPRVDFITDGAGRPSRILVEGGDVLERRYDGRGDEFERRFGDRVVTTRQFLRNGQIRAQAVMAMGATVWRREYVHETGGALLEAVEPGGVTRYRRDGSGSLIATIAPNGVRADHPIDEAGNVPAAPQRTARRIPNDPVVTDLSVIRPPPPEPLRSADGRIAYDDAGRRTRSLDASGKWTFRFDPFGRLREVSTDRVTVRYGYDALGRRISQVAGDRTTEYWWVGENVVREMTHAASDDGNPSTVIDYVTDGFEHVLMTVGGITYVVESDQVGLPRIAVDADGSVQWAATFTAFGEPAEEGKGRVTVLARFPGQWADQDTGFIYNRFRFYDPANRAYLSDDPIGLRGGGADYNYVPDPTSWIDPFGLDISENAEAGAEREAAREAELKEQYPNDSVQREQYLRDADGKRVKDPVTGEMRRVDFVAVSDDGTRVRRLEEVTSDTADKAAQQAKETRIRAAGGNYIRDRRTRKLVRVRSNQVIHCVRKP